ncbi:hypothetical protein HO173_010575 [Letharia columbiana]|uniref:Uncharacterized protein n=1 Tax=Letharia columbiana TaxID=112416 RepID=A0A8H6FMG2_9LECA|nr:uncharacterized protein HO173_010575 [Letharia columbiana]KAF6231243.1 hypothetical protein HO173_010575 [Letharia columbiana]
MCHKAEILANARAMGHDCVDGEDGDMTSRSSASLAFGQLSQKCHKTSIIALSAGLSKFQEYWDGDVTQGSYGKHCSSPNIDIKQLTEQAVEEATE